MKLKVPYKSQWGVGANESRDDCGPACVAMLLAAYGVSKTVDEVFWATGAFTNTLITFDQLIKAGRSLGLNIQHHILSLKVLKQKIKDGFPVIALVNYKHFPKKQDKYNGPHFVVVFGQTANTIVCHDPNRLRGKTYGDTVTIKNEPWKKMWQLTNQEHGNKNCQVLIPNQSLKGGEVEMDRRKTIKSIYNAIYHRDPSKSELDRWDASQKATSETVAELWASLEIEKKLESLAIQTSSQERAVNELAKSANLKFDNLATDVGQIRGEMESDRKIVSDTASKTNKAGELIQELQEEDKAYTGLLGGLGSRLLKTEEKVRKLLEKPSSNSTSGEGVNEEVKIVKVYEGLPKEIKVSLFIIVSFGVQALIKSISGAEFDSAFGTAVANIALVFLQETKKRVDKRK